MTGFYLGNKIIRLLVTIMLIVTYALIVKEGLLLFAVNAFALHIITMAYMGYYCIREEQKRKQIQT